MAYENIQNSVTLVFTESKIRQYIALIQLIRTLIVLMELDYCKWPTINAINLLHEFIHRTLQELLAAWYLSRQYKSFQQKKLQNIFNKNTFIKFPDASMTIDIFHFGNQYSSSLSNCISRELQTTLQWNLS